MSHNLRNLLWNCRYSILYRQTNLFFLGPAVFQSAYFVRPIDAFDPVHDSLSPLNLSYWDASSTCSFLLSSSSSSHVPATCISSSNFNCPYSSCIDGSSFLPNSKSLCSPARFVMMRQEAGDADWRQERSWVYQTCHPKCSHMSCSSPGNTRSLVPTTIH